MSLKKFSDQESNNSDRLSAQYKQGLLELVTYNRELLGYCHGKKSGHLCIGI
jgi:hypothetical protein